MSKYANMVVSRELKPVLKKAIRKHPDYKAYSIANAFDPNTASTAELLAACEALSIDAVALDSMIKAHVPVTPNQEMDTAMNEAIEKSEADTEASPEASTAAASSYEGRDPGEVIAEALAPASPHMTVHLQGLLPPLLTALATAATQGPRIIRETVTRDAPSVGASTPPVVNVIARKSVRDAFGLGKRFAGQVDWGYTVDHVSLPICDYAGAPAIDPDYVFDPAILAQLAAADAGGLNVLFSGPAGTGKTEGAMQYAARTGRPFFRIPIDLTIERPDILGQEVPSKDGGMVWADGMLARAFRVPYAVILIDEPSLLRQGTAAIFQTALDVSRCLNLPTGEVLQAAQGICIIAADNTDGSGDNTGRYIGTAPMNAALADRFGVKLAFGHMPAEKESTMLAHRTGLTRDACALMVAYAGVTRADADSGKLTLGVTPRRLLAWAKSVKLGIPSAKAFLSCVIAGSTSEDREVLLQLQETSLKSDHDRIDGLARGTIVPEAPKASPSDAGEALASTPSPVGSTFPQNY